MYQSLEFALRKHAEVDVMVNFASFRSAYETSLEALGHPQLSVIAIIAEGVPERQSRQLLLEASCREHHRRSVPGKH